jgi:hypothetical protein
MKTARLTTRLTVGILGFIVVLAKASAATLYVSLESTNPMAPYATWETAARTIVNLKASHGPALCAYLRLASFPRRNRSLWRG